MEQYIINTLRWGYKPVQIRNELIREGFRKDEIDEAFEFVMKKRKI